MKLANLIAQLDHARIGEEVHQLVRQLYPICRSITGDGVRDTLRILQDHVPFTIQQVPSGTKIFDWVVPNEWNIRDAWIKNPRGEKIVDFQSCNLHVVNYSIPVHSFLTLTKLREHLFTLPDQADWVPYRTAYYDHTWGFCVSHNTFSKLEEGTYEVLIDSSLQPGQLTYGEHSQTGSVPEEVLIYAHICHPSLCNDNLSGVAILTVLAKHLHRASTRLSYRFVLAPGTVGAITWLHRNETRLAQVAHGLVLSCLGDTGISHYKKSRQGNAHVDRAVRKVLEESGSQHKIIDFFPYGYDERQFCSPGFDLPVGCMMRTPHGQFAEYHTSADNTEFVKPASLADSLLKILSVCRVLDGDRKLVNQTPKGEPYLRKHGLGQYSGAERMALLWVLNLSDGNHSLLDIAERAHLSFAEVEWAAERLEEQALLRPPDA